MKFRLGYIALPVFLATLAFNSWTWGSASLLDRLGPVIAHSAEREAPLVQTYMVIGAKAIVAAGAEASAQQSAETAFGPAREQLLNEPVLAMDDLFSQTYSSQQSWAVRLHWVCPAALLAFFVGWWLRPKQIQTIRPASRR